MRTELVGVAMAILMLAGAQGAETGQSREQQATRRRQRYCGHICFEGDFAEEHPAVVGRGIGPRLHARSHVDCHRTQRTADDRGVRRARFAVLRTLNCPGVLIEGGFMSSRKEAALIADAAYRQKIAEAVAAGIVDYVIRARPVTK